MEWKKNVNTNLGITIILVFAALFVIIDFYVICSHIDGYPFNELSGNTTNNTINENNTFIKEDVVDIIDEATAIKIGNEKYNLASDLLFYPGFTVETDNDSDVKYIIDNNIFVVTSEWQQGIYFKVFSGIEKYLDVFSGDMMNQLFEYSNGAYYSDMTPSGGRGKRIDYISTELKVIEITDNSLLFDAVSSYYANTEDMINGVSVDDAEIVTESNLFELVLNNGEWKVNNFTIPY